MASDYVLPQKEIDAIIDLALAEDLGGGDITTDILVPPELQGKASVLIKKAGVLAGIEVAARVFRKVDPSLEFDVLIRDGTRVRRGDIAATVSGSFASILKAERVALNFLQRLSGVATQTARYVARTRGFPARIVDTRKTTPGLRALEKYAVRMGGGKNHRMNLSDGILVKDNHIAACRLAGMGLKEIVARVKRQAPPGMRVEIEATTIAEALEAAAAGADIILLDNMSPEDMKQVVSQLPPRVETEASGGITLSNVHKAAASGVNIISIGALTHSVKALDISLEVELQTRK